MRLHGYWIACVLGLIACEGSGGVGDGGVPQGGNGGGLPPRSGIVVGADPSVATTELARALCAKAYECDRSNFGAVTQEECAVYFSQPCLFFGDVRPEDGLSACVALVRSATCDDEGLGAINSTACSDAFARARARQAGLPVRTAAGESCGDGVACIGDLVCTGFSSQCGVCEEVPRVGDACGENGECWAGYCDEATNRCLEYKADGESCADHEECENFNCSAAGICKPEVGTDFTCIDDSDCGDDRCVNGQCVDGPPPGGACSSHADCEDGFCEDGICKLSARCELGEVGDPCGFIGCAANLQCVGNVCVAFGAPGMPEGSSCSSDEQCATGYCGSRIFGDVDSVCAKLPSGRQCDADDQCSSGLCAAYRCAGAGSCTE